MACMWLEMSSSYEDTPELTIRVMFQLFSHGQTHVGRGQHVMISMMIVFQFQVNSSQLKSTQVNSSQLGV